MKKNLCVFSFGLSLSLLAADNAQPTRLEAYKKTLAEMVAADTSNPPGNESRIVKIVGEKLKAAEIPYDVVEFGPGRENIVARIQGTGEKRPLLLLAHIDVVGADHQPWTSDPHRMMDQDGFLVGRGVSDDLGNAALYLQTFLDLKKSGVKLKRDVILALTGDEESAGLGVRTVLEKRPELLGAELVLNEGGGIVTGENGKVEYVSLQTAEKNYQDFTLSVTGTTGHSSVPLKDNAIYRLAKVLEKLSAHTFPPRLVPVTRSFLAKRANLETGEKRAAMLRISAAKKELPKKALAELEKDPILSATLRTTCVATVLNGGTRVNALPSQATANVNCRILPDETVEQVKVTLEKIMGDPSVRVMPAERWGGSPASEVDGEGPSAIEKIVAEMWPGAPVIPSLSRGATDSRFFRMKGIAAYGISGLGMTEADGRRAHGIDERIPVTSIEPALDFTKRLVLELAEDRARVAQTAGR